MSWGISYQKRHTVRCKKLHFHNSQRTSTAANSTADNCILHVTKNSLKGCLKMEGSLRSFRNYRFENNRSYNITKNILHLQYLPKEVECSKHLGKNHRLYSLGGLQASDTPTCFFSPSYTTACRINHSCVKGWILIVSFCLHLYIVFSVLLLHIIKKMTWRRLDNSFVCSRAICTLIGYGWITQVHKLFGNLQKEASVKNKRQTNPSLNSLFFVKILKYRNKQIFI